MVCGGHGVVLICIVMGGVVVLMFRVVWCREIIMWQWEPGLFIVFCGCGEGLLWHRRDGVWW